MGWSRASCRQRGVNDVHPGRAGALATLVVVALSACAGAGSTTTPIGSATSATPGAAPTADEPTQTPVASEPARPSPSKPPTGQTLGEGWVEVGSFGGDATIEAVHDVVAAPFGLLAAGVHYPTRALGVFDPLAADGRIWLSTDGMSWADVTPAETFVDASIRQLVELPDGAVLALGWASRFVDGSLVENGPAVWETRDGVAWTELELDDGDPVIEIARGGAGYLAIRGELDGQRLEFSSDGRIFTPIVDPTGSRIVTRIAAGPEGFVIRADVYGSADPPTLYASGNGVDWYEAVTSGWHPGELAPVGPDWIAVDQRPFEVQDDTEVRAQISANGLEWAEAGRLLLRTIDVGGGAICGEFPDLISTGTLVVASTALSFPCGEGLVQVFGAVHVTDDGGTWLALPFGVEVDGRSSRGTRVSAGLDLESGTLLVGEIGFRATFWFRPGE